MNIIRSFLTNVAKLKRPNDPIAESFVFFDVTSLEISKSSLLAENTLLRHQSNSNYGRFCYEVLYKRTHAGSVQYFSVFRTDKQKKSDRLFVRLYEVLNPLIEEINTKLFGPEVDGAFQETVQMVYMYSSWTCAHVAAQNSLTGAFKSSNQQIMACLNETARPLRRTPLMLAVFTGNLETVKAILALNPDVEKLDRRLNSVLHFAAVCEKSVFRCILKHCVNKIGKRMLYQRNSRNATPLHFACYGEAIDNVLYMLKLGLPADFLTIEPPSDINSLNSANSTEQSRVNSAKEQVEQETQTNYLNLRNELKSCKSESGIDEVVVAQPAKSQEKVKNNEKEIAFTDDMLEDMDIEDIKLGGTPLHWCMFRRTLEQLIDYDFKLNAIDLNHETALFRSVSKHRLKCVLFLLNAGADPNKANLSGNNCLHEAVMKADIPAVQALVSWECNLDEKNNAGFTARHLASIASSKNHRIIVYVLHAVGAKRCDPETSGCTDDCAANGTGIGEKFAKWADFEKPSPMEHYLNNWEELIAKIKENKNDTVTRMICFDGGGTKGLITLQILLELQKRLSQPLHFYFEWLVGTSTGSIIASLLALGYALKPIQIIYYALKDKVMVGVRPYSSSLLEHVLRNILGPQVRMSDVNKMLMITATLADRSPIQLHLFRSFESPSEIIKGESLKKVETELSKLDSVDNKSDKSQESNKTKTNENEPTKKLLTSYSHYYDDLNSCDSLLVIRKLNEIILGAKPTSKTPLKKTSSSQILRMESNEAAKNVSKDSTVKDEIVKTLPSTQSTLEIKQTTELSSPKTLASKSSYSSSHHPKIEFATLPNYREQLLWKACRSSGAAPTFFRASGAFIDGGLIANNPSLDALTAFTKHNYALKTVGRQEEVKKMQLLLSIGTGKPPVIPTEVIDVGSMVSINPYEPYQSTLQTINLAKEMMAMATQTDAHVVERAHAWCASTNVAYFRLNPPIGENLQLNVVEESEIVNALWETKAYMRAQSAYIDMLVSLLEESL